MRRGLLLGMALVCALLPTSALAEDSTAAPLPDNLRVERTGMDRVVVAWDPVEIARQPDVCVTLGLVPDPGETRCVFGGSQGVVIDALPADTRLAIRVLARGAGGEQRDLTAMTLPEWPTSARGVADPDGPGAVEVEWEVPDDRHDGFHVSLTGAGFEASYDVPDPSARSLSLPAGTFPDGTGYLTGEVTRYNEGGDGGPARFWVEPYAARRLAPVSFVADVTQETVRLVWAPPVGASRNGGGPDTLKLFQARGRTAPDDSGAPIDTCTLDYDGRGCPEAFLVPGLPPGQRMSWSLYAYQAGQPARVTTTAVTYDAGVYLDGVRLRGGGDGTASTPLRLAYDARGVAHVQYEGPDARRLGRLVPGAEPTWKRWPSEQGPPVPPAALPNGWLAEGGARLPGVQLQSPSDDRFGTDRMPATENGNASWGLRSMASDSRNSMHALLMRTAHDRTHSGLYYTRKPWGGEWSPPVGLIGSGGRDEGAVAVTGTTVIVAFSHPASGSSGGVYSATKNAAESAFPVPKRLRGSSYRDRVRGLQVSGKAVRVLLGRGAGGEVQAGDGTFTATGSVTTSTWPSLTWGEVRRMTGTTASWQPCGLAALVLSSSGRESACLRRSSGTYVLTSDRSGSFAGAVPRRQALTIRDRAPVIAYSGTALHVAWLRY